MSVSFLICNELHLVDFFYSPRSLDKVLYDVYNGFFATVPVRYRIPELPKISFYLRRGAMLAVFAAIYERRNTP